MNPSPGHLFRLAIVGLFVVAVAVRALVGMWQAGSSRAVVAVAEESPLFEGAEGVTGVYSDLVRLFGKDSEQMVD